MQILIFGDSSTSLELAKTLSTQGHCVSLQTPLPLLAHDAYDIQLLPTSLQLNALFDSPSSLQPELVVAAKSNDAENLLICQLARHYHVKESICILDNGYAKFHPVFFAKHKKHHRSINTNEHVAHCIHRMLALPGCLDYLSIAQSSLSIACIDVPEHSACIGLSTESLSTHIDKEVKAFRILRNQRWLLPNSQTCIEQNDKIIFFITHPTAQISFKRFLGYTHTQTIVIAGINRITTQLVILLSAHSRIKVIAKASNTTSQFATDHPHITVLEGEATDLEVLETEQIGTSDVFLALTSDDEDNLVCALQAKKMGCQHVFALTRRQELIPIIETSPVDTALYPPQMVFDTVASYTFHHKINTYHPLAYGMGEIIETTLPDYFHQTLPKELPESFHAHCVFVIRSGKHYSLAHIKRLKKSDRLLFWAASKEDAESILNHL